MLAALPHNGSQLERAVGAWLVEVTKDNATGFRLKPEWIYFLNDSRVRADAGNPLDPVITVLAASFQPSTKFTGNREWMVTAEVKFKAINPKQADNPLFNRLQIDLFVGLVEAAMAQYTEGSRKLDVTRDGITSAGRALATTGSDKDKLNNADMAAFTCLFVDDCVSGSRGHPAHGGHRDRTFWVESRVWPITACPSAIS